MSYSIETTARFNKEFKKLDKYTQRMIKGWIEKNLVGEENPRRHGKGDYRLLCHIDDGKLIILALSVGHRREIYEF